MEKGKLVGKLKTLRQRHKQALLIRSESILADGEKWQVLSSNQQELYNVQKVKECKKCQLQCLHCRSCFHEFLCTCMDNSIKNNMCKHIHAVARSLPNIEATNKEESLEIDIDDETMQIETTIISELRSKNNDKDANRREIKCVFEQILEKASSNEQLEFVEKRLKEVLSAIEAMELATNGPVQVRTINN